MSQWHRGQTVAHVFLIGGLGAPTRWRSLCGLAERDELLPAKPGAGRCQHCLHHLELSGPRVRVVHHDEPSRVRCIRVGCDWTGSSAAPESEAARHADEHPGHTAVVEASYWIEYTAVPTPEETTT